MKLFPTHRNLAGSAPRKNGGASVSARAEAPSPNISFARAEAPPQKWPLWAIALRALKTETETGVGDTVARVVGPFGGEAFKKWYAGIFGKTCGCEKRQAEWNTRYPY